MDFLNNKDLRIIDGNLYFGDWNCLDLAEKFGTPIYVINEKVIVQRYNDLLNVLKKYYNKIRIHYAVKANTNMAVLSIIKKLDAYLDCVSTGEIYIAKKVGFSPEKILYTGNNYTNNELNFAIENRVRLNLDARSQLDRLIKIFDSKDLKNNRPLLSFRVNPEFGGGHHDHCITAGPNVKFGILEHDIIDAYRNAIESGFNDFGIHMHIGSGILNIETFETAAKKFLGIVGKIKEALDVDFEFIDFGGGLGIPYHPEQEPLDLDEYARAVISIFKEYNERYSLNDPYFCIEPGRFIVAESCIILSRVNTIKQMRDQKYVGIDGGFNLLIRPTMYGSYHHILVANKMNKSKTDTYNITGPICESGDVLAKNRKLPKIEDNDLIAILDSGAYGFTMSSNYNSRPKPAEILISGEASAVVRSEETYDDLIKNQNIPKFLK